MKKLESDIKNGTFATVYLLHGEESYLVNTYKKKLIEVICESKESMNYSYFEGEKSSVSEIMEMCRTMPFFADRRMVLVENSGFFMKSNVDLAEYMAEIPDTTHLVFVERNVDQRGKLFKELSKHGYASKLDQQDQSVLIRWIARKLQAHGLHVEGSTAAHLIEVVGGSMDKLHNEIEKLGAYAMGRDVLTKEDIHIMCVGEPVDKVFDIVDAMIKNEQGKALKYYYDLVVLSKKTGKNKGRGTAGILGTMTTHFKRLLDIKCLGRDGFSKADIAKMTGIYIKYLDKYIAQSNGFTKEELVAILEDIADTIQEARTGIFDEALGVELLIVKYSTPCYNEG